MTLSASDPNGELLPVEVIEYALVEHAGGVYSTWGWCSLCGLGTPYRDDVTQHALETGHQVNWLFGTPTVFWRERVEPEEGSAQG